MRGERDGIASGFHFQTTDLPQLESLNYVRTLESMHGGIGTSGIELGSCAITLVLILT